MSKLITRTQTAIETLDSKLKEQYETKGVNYVLLTYKKGEVNQVTAGGNETIVKKMVAKVNEMTISGKLFK